MKIVVLTIEYPTKDNPLGGIFVKDHNLAIKKLGYKVSVFYNYFKSLKELSIKNFYKFFFKNYYFSNNGINHSYTFLFNFYLDRIKIFLDYFLTKKKLDNYIKLNGKPDLIICHFSFPVILTAKKIHEKYGIPFIIIEHSTGYFTNLFSKKQLRLISAGMKSAFLVICVSHYLKKKLKSLFHLKNLSTIGNVVDTKIFCIKKKIKHSEKRFLTVSQLVKKKQLDKLLICFNNLNKKNKKFKLFIVGSGPEYSNLKKFVKENNLQKKVFFMGYLNKIKISKLFESIDYYLSSSSIETFGISIAEALATGTPVLAINSGGPLDFLDNKNSIIVDNFNEFEKKLENVINHKIIFNKNYLRKKIVNSFKDIVIANKVNREIKKLLNL